MLVSWPKSRGKLLLSDSLTYLERGLSIIILCLFTCSSVQQDADAALLIGSESISQRQGESLPSQLL